jgi:hypothetical protein
VAAAAQAPVSDYIPTVIQPDPSWPTPPAGMIYIPTADVWLGADDDALNPRRLVHVEGFFIDRTEVTTASFEGCVGSGRCSPHVRPATLPLALKPDDPVARWLVEQCNFGLADRRDHPMNCVTGTEAAAYCAAQGGDFRMLRNGSTPPAAPTSGASCGGMSPPKRTCTETRVTAPCVLCTDPWAHTNRCNTGLSRSMTVSPEPRPSAAFHATRAPSVSKTPLET